MNNNNISVGINKKEVDHLQRQVQLTSLNCQITLVSYSINEDMEYLTTKAISILDKIKR